MADLSGHSPAAVGPPIQDEAAAKSGAQGEHHKIGQPPACTVQPFADSRAVGVIFQIHRAVEMNPKQLFKWHILQGQVAGVEDFPLRHRAGDAYANRVDFPLRNTGLPDRLSGQFCQAADQRLRAFHMPHRH